jgi:hypothetical protein
MTIDGCDIVHAPIADGRLYREFTLFLFMPGGTGAAAGHNAGNAVVSAQQPYTSMPVIIKMA